MVELLKVPYLGTAEEDVLLSAWLVAEGETFQKGDTLAVVETLKAAFDVEAERAGVLVRQLVPAGDRVAVQAPLGVVAADGEAPGEAEIEQLVASAPPPSGSTDAAEGTGIPDAAPPTRGDEPDASPAARARARELGVDLRSIRGTGARGLVRVEDVEAAAATPDGVLDPEFADRLHREAEAFGALSSELKVAVYRRFGARIGEGVVLGADVVLKVRRLVLGDGSRFGDGTTVEADELVTGRIAQFGPRCRVRCRRIRLGDNAFFAPDVEIGGGGAMEPEAELVVGSHGFVGERTHLNPCRRLEIGDEVVVSRGAVVMTHSFGGSVLQGYPNRFAPVRIGDRCQVGIHAMLFPGVEMGAGSILLSNSTLVTSVPAGRMFGGVPATDLRAAAHAPSPEQLGEIAADLVREFARQLGLRGREVALEEVDGGTTLSVQDEGGVHRLTMGERPATSGALPREELWVGTAIGEEAFAAAPPELTVFDLGTPRVKGPSGPLADAFREFLRKRGVRLGTWTYPGGWL